MQSLVNYALAYAKAGYYVLPIAAGDKTPLVEFADRPPMTAAEIKQAWQRHPNANIALRTVDFFVVDIDEHEDGADGKASFKEYGKDHRDLFPPTLMQKTGHGGIQIFYKKPRGSEMTQVIGWLPGVDVKAHVNNYVLAAPSSGYKWQNDEEMALAPQELVDAIYSVKKQVSHDEPDFEQMSLTDRERQLGQRSKTAELFEQIVNGLGETGGRNMALAAFVGGLLYRNVNAKAVYELAMLANQNTPKSLDDREFDKTFNSMVKKEMRRRSGY
ncbi:bifunctional DNA primase/polymerase [Lacticaseibacillus salsurivasis]|uniref:bifunctional DNA primase/polymerase n=1 Tax=Lacticaseibacillus salsurivasis TaxID=3081441 RepID=UPI0030C6992D